MRSALGTLPQSYGHNQFNQFGMLPKGTSADRELYQNMYYDISVAHHQPQQLLETSAKLECPSPQSRSPVQLPTGNSPDRHQLVSPHIATLNSSVPTSHSSTKLTLEGHLERPTVSVSIS